MDIPFDNQAFYGSPMVWDEFVPDVNNGTIASIPVATSGTFLALNLNNIGIAYDPSANFEIYLARIIALLNESGARHNLTFVTQRSRAEAIKAIPQEIQSSSQWTDPPKVGRGGRRSIRYSK